MAGKGSKPRPMKISRKEYDSRFDKINFDKSGKEDYIVKSSKDVKEKTILEAAPIIESTPYYSEKPNIIYNLWNNTIEKT